MLAQSSTPRSPDRRCGGGSGSAGTSPCSSCSGGRNVPDRETLFFSAPSCRVSGRRGPDALLSGHPLAAQLLDLLETSPARVRDVPVLFLALARPCCSTIARLWQAACRLPALPLDRLRAMMPGLAKLLLTRPGALLPARRSPRPRGQSVFTMSCGVAVGKVDAQLHELPRASRKHLASRLDATAALEERSVLRRRAVVGPSSGGVAPHVSPS